MSKQRTERKPPRAPEPPRKQDQPKPEPRCEPEPVDEENLDDVLRDCPL